MKAQLFINGMEADMDGAVSVPITYQMEDLSNPTAKQISFSKTVNLPATNRNNQLFEHIWRFDHSNMNFVASQRVPFVLTWNNTVTESGYVKLNNVNLGSGYFPRSYDVTLYGGLGEFFYSLSEKDMKTLTVDESLYAHAINRQSVFNSWYNEHYRYFLTYSGLYDNFDSDKIFRSFAQGGNDIIDMAYGDGKLVALTQDGYLVQTDQKTYVEYRFDSLESIPTEVTDTSGILYDEYSNIFIIYGVKRLSGYFGVYYTSNPEQDNWTEWYPPTTNRRYGNIVNGHILNHPRFGSYAFITDTGYMITFNDITDASNAEFSQVTGNNDGLVAYTTKPTISRWTDGTNIYGIITGGGERQLWSFYQTSSTQVAPSRTQEVAFGNIDFTDSTCTKDSSAPNYLYVSTWQLNPSEIGRLSQVYRAQKSTSNQLSWEIVGTALLSNRIYGIKFLNGSLYYYGDNGFIYQLNGNTATQIPTDTNYSIHQIVFGEGYYFARMYDNDGTVRIGTSTDLRTWTISEGLYFSIETDDLNEHQRNEFRSYYQRPGLRLKDLITGILNDSGYTYTLGPEFFTETNPYWQHTWVLMPRLQYNGEPPLNQAGNIRTGDQVSFSDMMNTGVNQLDFLINFIKVFGLYITKDVIRKHVTIQTRNEFFSDYEIVDWTNRIDFNRTTQLDPIIFDFKYGIFNWDDAGSYYEEQYQKEYDREYGFTRVNTGYQFNDNQKEFIPKNIFQNTVMTTRYDTLFKDRNKDDIYADDKLLPALFTISNNQMDYNDSGLHLVFSRDMVPVNELVYISDDNQDMTRIAIYMWNDNEGERLEATEIPQCDRKLDDAWSLDFSRPQKLYYNPEGVDPYPFKIGLYDRFYERFTAETYSDNTKVLEANFYLSPIDIANFNFNQFVKINNTIWRVDKIIDYDLTKEWSTKVRLIRLGDIDNLTKGQFVVPNFNWFWNTSNFENTEYNHLYKNPDTGWTFDIVQDTQYGSVFHVTLEPEITSYFRNRIFEYRTSMPWQNGDYWTLSFIAKGKMSGTVTLRSTGASVSYLTSDNIPVNVDNFDWSLYEYTFKITNAGVYIPGETDHAPVISLVNTGSDFYITNIKLERSKFATAYVPATDDPTV